MFALIVRSSGLTPRLRHVLYRSATYNVQFTRFFASADRSKVEETLKMLKEDLERQQEEDTRIKKESKIALKKLPIKDRVIHELKHYYHGFRLLILETRLSIKYVYRLIRGDNLSRRERQQLVRTVSDMFRLVPFSFFIIVPFMELALPFFIKFFPNMLPSTFQDTSKEEEKIRKQLKLRVEMAKFLQDTLGEIGLERRNAEKTKESKAFEFAEFIRRTRTEGSYVSNEEIFKFVKLFEDELTLDNLSMSQLRALCRMLGIQPIGTPEILRFQLMLKLRELKADDRLITAEGGVDQLSAKDLQAACRARGMRAYGVSQDRLKEQLKQWLELSLNDKVPPSLLLLTRALYLPEEFSFAQRLRTILNSLPEELGEETKQKLTELEGGSIDHKERLALIRRVEEGLKKERQAADEAAKKRAEEKKTDEKKAEEEKQKSAETIAAEVTTKQTEKEKSTEKPAKSLDEVIIAAQSAVKELHKEVQPPVFDKPAANTSSKKQAEDPKAPKLDKEILESLEDILHGNSLQEARHDISELKEKVIEHAEDLIEVKSLANDYDESKIAKRLRSRVNSMISGVDSLVARLESERRFIKEEVKDPALEVTDKKAERLVRIQDLLDSLTKLQKASSEAKSLQIEEALKALDDNTDGQIDVNLALEVIEMLGKHKDVEISSAQISKIIELLKKEDAIEEIHRNEEHQSEIIEKIMPKLLTADEQFPIRPLKQESPPTQSQSKK